MPTKNRRVATYLPKEIDASFEAFKTARGIEGDSQALIIILSEFLGVSQQVAHLDHSSFVLQSDFDALRSEVSRMSMLLDELRCGLPSELLKDTQQNGKVETIAALPDCVEQSLETVNHPPQAVTSKVSLLASGLAKRLGAGQSTLSERKKDSPEKFAEWSSAKDPDGIAWAFLPESNRFQPISELSFELQSKLLDETKIFPSDTLSTGELAKRLDLGSSTLSHWKKDKTPDELLQATREKDPSKIGWILLPELNRFKPERDLPNEQINPLQGELLSESDSMLPDL